MMTMKHWMNRMWKEEEGLGTLEILLIVAVLVAIAIVFRKWIVSWFQKLIGGANTDLKNSTVDTACVPGPNQDCSSP
jgi:Flp pilus assembly pilin Flp